eukprot:6420195-Amphidinium_carterae.1
MHAGLYQTKVQEGDREAHIIYEQMELSQEVENLLENYNDDGSAGEDQNGTEDASMQDANEEPPRTESASEPAGSQPGHWEQAPWSPSCGRRQRPRPSRKARNPADPSSAYHGGSAVCLACQHLLPGKK